MRLTIRRKIVGTLVMVGLLPLAISLLTIVGLGARTRVETLRHTYGIVAYSCAQAVSQRLAAELQRLNLFARLPAVVAYVRQQDARHSAGFSRVAAAIPAGRASDTSQPASSMHSILHNPLAYRLRLIGGRNAGPAHFVVTDRYGNLIAADVPPRRFLAEAKPFSSALLRRRRNEIYIRAVRQAPSTGAAAVVLVIPIDARQSLTPLGYIQETMTFDALRRRLQTHRLLSRATVQIYDRQQKRTVLLAGSAKQAALAQRHFAQTRPHLHGLGWLENLLAGVVIGNAPVHLSHLVSAAHGRIHGPAWSVLVSQPATLVLAPILMQARMIGGAGLLLIVGLFLVGFIISQREFVAPVAALRQATAAIGRGQLNVRLLSPGERRHALFHDDELADLARDFEQMTRRLQQHRNKLEQSDQAKKRFIDLAAHELRTPVTRIRAAVTLLRRQLTRADLAVPAAQASDPRSGDSTVYWPLYLDNISAATARLEKIVTDLTKLVESNRFSTQLHRQRFDVRQLILETGTQSRVFFAARRQQLDISVPPTLPEFDGDPDKIADALTNVLSNASRFSPDGSTIRLTAHATFGDLLEILVEDSGPGLPAQVLEELFEPFRTGGDVLRHQSPTAEEKSSGLGLGLAIVRRFVELHGGTVRIQPLPRGTQVQMLLPFSQEQPVVSAPKPTEPAAAHTAGP